MSGGGWPGWKRGGRQLAEQRIQFLTELGRAREQVPLAQAYLTQVVLFRSGAGIRAVNGYGSARQLTAGAGAGAGSRLGIQWMCADLDANALVVLLANGTMIRHDSVMPLF